MGGKGMEPWYRQATETASLLAITLSIFVARRKESFAQALDQPVINQSSSLLLACANRGGGPAR